MHPGLHADLPCLRVRPGEQVVDADRRHDKQLHRVDDPAVVIGSPGSIRDDLVPMRCFAQYDAVNRLIGGIEDTDREQVVPAGANRVGHIEHKRGLATFVPADGACRSARPPPDSPPPRTAAASARRRADSRSRQTPASTTPRRDKQGKTSWMIHGTLVGFASGRGASNHFSSRPTFVGSVASSHWSPSRETTVELRG